jgi:hypothetical protein
MITSPLERQAGALDPLAAWPIVGAPPSSWRPSAALAAALELAAAGLAVYRVQRGSKAAVRGWQKDATTDPQTLRRWFASGRYDVGIYLASSASRSGLVALDADTAEQSAELERLAAASGWPGFIIRSRRGVKTLATLEAADCPAHKLNECPGLGGVEVLRGGVVAWAHDDLGRVWLGRPADVGPAPEWMAAPIRAHVAAEAEKAAQRIAAFSAAPATAPERGRWLTYGRGILGRLVAGLKDAPPGQRNGKLYGAALRVERLTLAGCLLPGEAAARLQAAAEAAGLVAGEVAATIASATRAAAKEGPAALPLDRWARQDVKTTEAPPAVPVLVLTPPSPLEAFKDLCACPAGDAAADLAAALVGITTPSGRPLAHRTVLTCLRTFAALAMAMAKASPAKWSPGGIAISQTQVRKVAGLSNGSAGRALAHLVAGGVVERLDPDAWGGPYRWRLNLRQFGTVVNAGQGRGNWAALDGGSPVCRKIDGATVGELLAEGATLIPAAIASPVQRGEEPPAYLPLRAAKRDGRPTWVPDSVSEVNAAAARAHLAIVGRATPAEMAAALGSSPRTWQRTLNSLGNLGYCALTSERSGGRGRPAMVATWCQDPPTDAAARVRVHHEARAQAIGQARDRADLRRRQTFAAAHVIAKADGLTLRRALSEVRAAERSEGGGGRAAAIRWTRRQPDAAAAWAHCRDAEARREAWAMGADVGPALVTIEDDGPPEAWRCPCGAGSMGAECWNCGRPAGTLGPFTCSAAQIPAAATA